MDVSNPDELRGKLYSYVSYTHLLTTTKGKRIGCKRESNLFVLGWMDGGKSIKEFNQRFLSPKDAWEEAVKIVKKLDDEGRGKRTPKKSKVKKEGGEE